MFSKIISYRLVLLKAKSRTSRNNPFLDFLISETILLRIILYISQRLVFYVLLKFLYIRVRFRMRFIIWHSIHGCYVGLIETTLLGLACSAADIKASVMWLIFSSMSVDKITFSA